MLFHAFAEHEICSWNPGVGPHSVSCMILTIDDVSEPQLHHLKNDG